MFSKNYFKFQKHKNWDGSTTLRFWAGSRFYMQYVINKSKI